MHIKDDLLRGITFEELIITVLSNEPEVNEQTIQKVFNEILTMNLEDARYLLENHINEIIEIVNNNR